MIGPARKIFSTAMTLIFTASLLPASSVQEQQPAAVKVGDEAIRSNYIKPYKSRYKTSVVLPNGNSFDTGVWSEEVRHIELNGKSVIEVVQTWEQKVHKEVNPGWAARGLTNVTWTITNVVDPKTLAPLLSNSKSSLNNYQQIEFNGVTVKETNSTRPPSSNFLKSETKLDTPVFNYHAGLFGILLAGFPLKKGYAARIPTYKPSNSAAPGKIEWLNFKVTGKEVVTIAAGKKVEAWVVESDDKITYWLISKSPYVIKSLNTGFPNQKWIYELM